VTWGPAPARCGPGEFFLITCCCRVDRRLVDLGRVPSHAHGCRLSEPWYSPPRWSPGSGPLILCSLRITGKGRGATSSAPSDVPVETAATKPARLEHLSIVLAPWSARWQLRCVVDDALMASECPPGVVSRARSV